MGDRLPSHGLRHNSGGLERDGQSLFLSRRDGIEVKRRSGLTGRNRFRADREPAAAEVGVKTDEIVAAGTAGLLRRHEGSIQGRIHW